MHHLARCSSFCSSYLWERYSVLRLFNAWKLILHTCSLLWKAQFQWPFWPASKAAAQYLVRLLFCWIVLLPILYHHLSLLITLQSHVMQCWCWFVLHCDVIFAYPTNTFLWQICLQRISCCSIIILMWVRSPGWHPYSGCVSHHPCWTSWVAVVSFHSWHLFLIFAIWMWWDQAGMRGSLGLQQGSAIMCALQITNKHLVFLSPSMLWEASAHSSTHV